MNGIASLETTCGSVDDRVCQEERQERCFERIECFTRYGVLGIDGE